MTTSLTFAPLESVRLPKASHSSADIAAMTRAHGWVLSLEGSDFYELVRPRSCRHCGRRPFDIAATASPTPT
jgi:hypothetical protein